jgi:glutaredoxin
MADTVIAYTDPNCPHCRRLKQYLHEHNIPFENRDIVNDPQAAADFQRLNAPGVPYVQVGNDTVIGFDPQELDRVLQKHGIPIGQPT